MKNRISLYWDDFERRVSETVLSIKQGKTPPVRRVSVSITTKCNFRCDYCNVVFSKEEMSENMFDQIVNKYKKNSIIHITGGEPSIVKWLYPYIEGCLNTRFHLNTNAFIKPPRNIKRLKISLDSHNEEKFNLLVRNRKAFKNVVKHVKVYSKHITTSITYVLSKDSYKDAPAFMKWCRKEFPDLYAVFFRCYKGNNLKFAMNEADADIFFNSVRFKLEKEMDEESLNLFSETIDEKFRLFGDKRFPENVCGEICYLSLSERVFDWKGNAGRCSHLYRDNAISYDSIIKGKCISGCNRRLVKFNEDVAKRLNK